MGYLDDETENAISQMELNWCDKNSLHIGAYAFLEEQRPSLVGTARVVVATVADVHKRPPLLASYDRLVTILASQDPTLQQALRKGVLPLQLPIFHSQKLFRFFHEAVVHKEICGELSRVIVSDDFRGTWLSGRLVEFALNEAEKVGVNRIFLECLEIHQNMYERLGFKRIEGASARVISVNQTMIGMEFCRALAFPSPAGFTR
jgi:GNAT superfamily N-acetyltransferase